MIEVPQKEIARYLGYQGVTPDEKVQQVIDEVLDWLLTHCHPRMIMRTEPLTSHGETLCLGPIRTESQDLMKNLSGCSQVILLGATLGPEPDYQIRRFEKFDVLRATVTQAASAAMIEAYIDEQQEDLRTHYEALGLFMHPRYSPGYGDFPLTVQPDFLRVLDMPKRIGVTLTDGLLMMPSKSVTAVIGLSERPRRCRGGSVEEDLCAVCSMEACEYSKALSKTKS